MQHGHFQEAHCQCATAMSRLGPSQLTDSNNHVINVIPDLLSSGNLTKITSILRLRAAGSAPSWRLVGEHCVWRRKRQVNALARRPFYKRRPGCTRSLIAFHRRSASCALD